MPDEAEIALGIDLKRVNFLEKETAKKNFLQTSHTNFSYACSADWQLPLRASHDKHFLIRSWAWQLSYTCTTA